MEKKEEEFKEFEQQFINIAGNLQTSIDINMLSLLTKNLGQNYRPEELERLISNGVRLNNSFNITDRVIFKSNNTIINIFSAWFYIKFYKCSIFQIIFNI